MLLQFRSLRCRTLVRDQFGSVCLVATGGMRNEDAWSTVLLRYSVLNCPSNSERMRPPRRCGLLSLDTRRPLGLLWDFGTVEWSAVRILECHKQMPHALASILETVMYIYIYIYVYIYTYILLNHDGWAEALNCEI